MGASIETFSNSDEALSQAVEKRLVPTHRIFTAVARSWSYHWSPRMDENDATCYSHERKAS